MFSDLVHVSQVVTFESLATTLGNRILMKMQDMFTGKTCVSLVEKFFGAGNFVNAFSMGI